MPYCTVSFNIFLKTVFTDAAVTTALPVPTSLAMSCAARAARAPSSRRAPVWPMTTNRSAYDSTWNPPRIVIPIKAPRVAAVNTRCCIRSSSSCVRGVEDTPCVYAGEWPHRDRSERV